MIAVASDGWVRMTLARARGRLRDSRFWSIQAMVLAVTATHYAAEQLPLDHSLVTLHHVPVILYLLPVVYAGLHYGWEGGVLTALWCGVLTVPSITMAHNEDYHWVGDLAQVSVTLAVGSIVAWRVQLEARQRVRAEQASRDLADSEERYRGVFENADAPILLLDSSGRVVDANPAAVTFTGYGQEELPGLPVADLLGDAATHDILGGTTAGSRRLTLLRRDGESRAVVVAAGPASSAGEPALQLIVRDITESEQREARMQTYVREVTRAQEEERRRVARELHDDTAQSLVRLCRALEAIDDPRADATRELAEDILVNVRRFGRALRPSVLDDIGLVAAIEWLAGEVTARSRARVTVSVRGEPRRLPPESELLIFRITQESLSNVEKHAGACDVAVDMTFEGPGLRVTVTDDGAGFVPAGTGEPPDRLGLLGMQERARLLHADLAVDSEPGRGTRVSLAVPIATTVDAPAGA